MKSEVMFPHHSDQMSQRSKSLFVPIPNGPLFLKDRFSFATYSILNMSVLSKGDVFDKDFM